MIYVVGEILIDLLNETENMFSFHAGGAPYNVASMIASLGGKVTFQGSIGKDVFGEILLQDAKKRKFYKTLIKVHPKYNTTLATVYLDANRERSFSFIRKQNTDIYVGTLDEKTADKSNIIHFGSLMISSSKGMRTLLSLMKKGKQKGKLISFDANFRSDIMKPSVAYKRYLKLLPYIDILKLSEEEVSLLSQQNNFEDGITFLKQYADTIIITKGKSGSVLYRKENKIEVPSAEIKAVDTTGAGDGFFGGLLYYFDYLLENNKPIQWEEILKFANACGGYVTLHKGAIDVLPTREEIFNLIEI